MIFNTQGSYLICVGKHNICEGNHEIILIGNRKIKWPRICNDFKTVNFNSCEFKWGYSSLAHFFHLNFFPIIMIIIYKLQYNTFNTKQSWYIVRKQTSPKIRLKWLLISNTVVPKKIDLIWIFRSHLYWQMLHCFKRSSISYLTLDGID